MIHLPRVFFAARRSLIVAPLHHIGRTIMTTTTTTKLPSSMFGPPVASLVPPGRCQFGADFVSVSLQERIPVTATSSVLRFSLPDKDKPLNLSTCACILASATIDGENTIRPYTPISTNASVGTFDLLVKNYGAEAKMSRFMHEMLPGDRTVSFKHIPFNVKIQAPFGGSGGDNCHIGMLVGGTGVTPMIQALHAILGGSNETRATMLYGSKTSDDILGKELLHRWAEDYEDQFTLVDVLSDEPEESGWEGERGFIGRDLVEKYLPKPTDPNTMVFVCGPPPMYDALSGPRGESDKVSGLLADMGFTAEQVFKF